MNQALLQNIQENALRFLHSMRSPGKPFGHFRLCAHSIVGDEFSALGVALELWRMLGLPLEQEDLSRARDRVNQAQNPTTGLLIDPSWKGRLKPEGNEMLVEGDSFFTRTLICSLAAWNQSLDLPVRYLAELSTEDLMEKTRWNRAAHHRFALGDMAVLLQHNMRLGVPGAEEQFNRFVEGMASRQNAERGLWISGDPEAALTPSINFTFHSIKFTYNQQNLPLPHAERAIDSCLAACRDERYYSWETGFACNDLDLALVMYSASLDTDYRKGEIQEWARERIPLLLDIQKPDGGFSFYHDRAMEWHLHLHVSPGQAEGDLWGTLMYLGTLRMMVKMGWPDLKVPWGISRVHHVRGH